MEYPLYIISLIILLLCPAKRQCNSDDYTPTEPVSEILQPDSEDYSVDQLPNKDLLLTSAQNLVSFGEDGGIIMSVRAHHSDERSHSAKKMPFKLIKNGKNIDGHHHPFIIADLTTVSGVLSKVRYLFVIKRLRI